MAVGEWLAPKGEATAREIRAQAISGGSLISSKNGVWAKDGDYFVNIGEVLEQGQLKKIQIYRFNDELKLNSWLSAESAIYQDEAWLLSNVVNTQLSEREITRSEIDNQVWQSSLTPKKLGVVTVTPESLSVQGLLDYLDYLKANDQDPSRYQLAFWRKLVQPVTVAVMLLVALSFIFGPLRSVSMGARIMMGVITGIIFFVSNEVLGSLSLVYQFPAFIGAISPSIFFIILAWYFMNKKPT
jgi:lipopolysaccharide export system permease protein